MLKRIELDIAGKAAEGKLPRVTLELIEAAQGVDVAAREPSGQVAHLLRINEDGTFHRYPSVGSAVDAPFLLDAAGKIEED